MIKQVSEVKILKIKKTISSMERSMACQSSLSAAMAMATTVVPRLKVPTAYGKVPKKLRRGVGSNCILEGCTLQEKTKKGTCAKFKVTRVSTLTGHVSTHTDSNPLLFRMGCIHSPLHHLVG